MARFLVLLYDDEVGWAAGGPVAEEGIEAHARFARDHGDAVLGGEALEYSRTARSIRDGVVTDGPFVVTSDVLGGYYLIEADDIDAAIAIAKDVPTPFGGGVEVRPVMAMG